MSQIWSNKELISLLEFKLMGLQDKQIADNLNGIYGTKRTQVAISSKLNHINPKTTEKYKIWTEEKLNAQIKKLRSLTENQEQIPQKININHETTLPRLYDKIDGQKELYRLDNVIINQREKLITEYLTSQEKLLEKLDKQHNSYRGVTIEDALSMNDDEKREIIYLIRNPKRRIITPENNTTIGLIKIPEYKTQNETDKLILPVYAKDIETPSKTLVSILHDISMDILNKDADIKPTKSFNEFARYSIVSNGINWRKKAIEITRILKDNYADIGVRFLEDRPFYIN